MEHGDVSPCLEHHHGDGLSREHIPDNQLGDDIQANDLVRYGCDDTNGDDVDEGNELVDWVY